MAGFNTFAVKIDSTDAASATAGLYMPSMSAASAAAVYIKTAAAAPSANLAAFWTDIDLSHTALGYESIKLAAAANTTEQTIVDTTGAGILTSVIAPHLSGAGTMTVRITADNKVYTFLSPTQAATDRYLVGSFKSYASTTGASINTGIASANDLGFSNANSRYYMQIPPAAISEALIGLRFRSSLKVTIQGSVNITATAEELNCCACYTTSIPEGL